ncbi:MAG TPA: amidohydrolase family protein, partial [Candidatus Binataceae bacterium]|nr:amidohydrolase family protein [Candidatus Binataceae bacterium]
MTSVMLKGGRVIDPSSRIDGLYDIVVIDGAIDSVHPCGSIIPPEVAMVLDCNGLWVVPGLIDPHVHLRDPGFPQKENIGTGLRAAATGGFTTVAAMANTSPVNDSPEITRYMQQRAHAAECSRLVPVSAVTKGLQGKELVAFDAMIEAGARLFSDDGVPIDDPSVLLNAFDEAARTGFAISLHEEDRTLTGNGGMNAGDIAGDIAHQLGLDGIPATAETMRVRRDLALA